jgi:hypothetical protein
MLMLAAAVFVGSQACRPCHTAIAGAYAKTPMAQSSGRAEPLPTTVFTAAGHRYQVAGTRLTFDGGASSMDYFIGSNTAGRTWLREWNGYLFELPVTWYSQKKIWDASPGYEREPYVRLDRAVEPSCLLCHASQVRPVLGTQNRYGDPPFLENGVSCERCHGPGSEHARNPPSSSLVNPARLDSERRDSICSQCHLTGEARIERPGRRFAEFQAGERLADYATYFVWKLGRKDFKVTSHVEKLGASACRTASGGGLSCVTCHDPHTNANNTQTACTSCHAAAHHEDGRQKESCAGCHMPKTQSADASHGVLTDHSIPRVPNTTAPPVRGDLVSFPGLTRGAPDDDRALGLAYAELGEKRARDYLLRARPSDWPVRLRLAVLEPDPVRAAALYESVLKDSPGETSALVNLGTIYARSGRVEQAAVLWERALAANPATEQAVLNLSQIQPTSEAEATLKRYLELNPTSPGARARLAAITKKGP